MGLLNKGECTQCFEREISTECPDCGLNMCDECIETHECENDDCI